MTSPSGLTRPRLVLVTRPTPIERLLVRHGTLGQARFFLESRGEEIRWSEEAHETFHAGLRTVLSALPSDRRRTRVDRDELDRFLFAPDDVVVIVGQDGLVPNAAKYLRGQLAIGINPDPERNDGVLCRHRPSDFPKLLRWLDERSDEYTVERRSLVSVVRDDGQALRALNEVFVGHETHQSARYRLRVDGTEERQSSSGLLISTGTGASGWARSIAEQRELEEPLPGPEEPTLAWFVREPFPSVSTGTELSFGILWEGDTLEVVSEMGDGGTIFGDGIESDRLEFGSGRSARVSVAEDRLELVVDARR